MVGYSGDCGGIRWWNTMVRYGGGIRWWDTMVGYGGGICGGIRNKKCLCAKVLLLNLKYQKFPFLGAVRRCRAKVLCEGAVRRCCAKKKISLTD